MTLSLEMNEAISEKNWKRQFSDYGEFRGTGFYLNSGSRYILLEEQVEEDYEEGQFLEGNLNMWIFNGKWEDSIFYKLTQGQVPVYRKDG